MTRPKALRCSLVLVLTIGGFLGGCVGPAKESEVDLERQNVGRFESPTLTDPNDPLFLAACEWLRAFAPRKYGAKTDAEILKLERLDLFAAPAPEDLPHLARLPALRQLRIWDDGEFRRPPAFRVGRLDDDALLVLGQLIQLESLVIGGWNVPYTDAGLSHLCELPHLKRLNLCKAQNITDAGMAFVAQLGIENLDLTYTKITDLGLTRLLACESLIEVKYGWAAESRRWLQRFQERHPDRAFLR